MNNKKILAPNLRFNGFDGEWTIKTLDEIVNVIDCKHRTPEYVENGVPVVSPGTIKWGEIDLLSPTKRVIEAEYESLMDHCAPKKGDLVFSRNQSIGVASIIFNEDKFVLGQDTVLIQAKTVNSIFNYYRLQTNSVQTLISKLSGGSTFARINLKDLRKLKVTIVDSKSEQQKIASFLSAVDEKIKQLTRKKELLENYKKGVMQQLFSGKLKFKDENGKAFPKWEQKFLEELCELKNGYTFKSSSYRVEGKYLVVTIKNVQDGYMSGDFSKILTPPDNIETHQKLNLGDVLISMTGNVGRVCRVSFENCLLNQRVGKFEVKNVHPDYFYHLINNPEFQDAMINAGQGAAQMNIGKKDILEFKITAASSFEEQKKIANYLSNIDNKIEIVHKQITQTQTFKKGLLQQMFV